MDPNDDTTQGAPPPQSQTSPPGPVASPGVSPEMLRAINTAEESWNYAQNDYAQKLDTYNAVAARAAMNPPQASAQELQAASAQLDNSRNQVQKASSDLSSANREAARIEAQAAAKEVDPTLKAERQARADYYTNHAATTNAQATAALARASSYETPEQRAARETALETLRTQAASDLERQRAQSASDLETQRQQGATGLETQRQQGASSLEAQRGGVQLADTALQGQNRLTEIAATRDAAITEAQQKFAQDQDLETLRSSLARANAEALANTQAELQRQNQQSQHDLDQPNKDRQFQLDTQKAQQEGQYQRGELALRGQQLQAEITSRNQATEQAYRSKMGDSLQAMSKVGLDLGNEGVKYGAAPVAGLGAAIADPMRMAYQVFQDGLQRGMWNADRMPSIFNQAAPDSQGALAPTNASPPASPDQGGAPVPTGAGY